jgi:cyclophilin family peptidyl-prolyl cis-trans isomerase
LKIAFYGALMITLVACSQSNGETKGSEASDTASTATVASETTDTAATDTAAPTATLPPATEEKPMTETENQVAELHTTAGEIDIRFFPDVAPNHVNNFLGLARKGFYNGTKFHRVIPGFMVQGGDPNTISGDPSTWGTGGAPTHLRAEFNSVSHKRGIVSMARATDPDSASSQFFIVVKDSPFLDNQYTVFGEVTKGMDVADKIVNAPKDAMDRPINPVTITKIVVRDAHENEKGPAPK